jgi:hypothetical protein
MDWGCTLGKVAILIVIARISWHVVIKLMA